VSRPDVLVLCSAGPAETREVAAAFAPLCRPGDVLLAGGLGAGKTAFAQGLGAALGVPGRVLSPTFTLVNQYPLGNPVGDLSDRSVRTFLHADLYRLDRLQEVVDLGLGELVEDDGVALVEWGDAAEPVLGDGSLAVRLEAVRGADDHRRITVGPPGEVWSDRWPALSTALGRWQWSG
jgi:tRNA threonylcarbamoyladenosine biosynthesis protein TsaE